MLSRIAESVDKFRDEYPRLGGYDMAASVAVILNGGTREQVQAAFGLLASWQFEPKGGW
jgi:hypothetical protein